MVLLKGLITYGVNKLSSSVSTVDYGESSSVNFNDDSLDTVHENVTVSTSITSNRVNFDYILTSGLAVGDTINSDLLNIDSLAVNKNKYLDISKTNEKIIDSRQIIYVLVE